MLATLHLRLVMVAALVAAALVVARPGTAPEPPQLVATAAGDLLIANSHESQAILDVTGMAPGENASGTLTLSNKASGPQSLRLSTTSIDDEPGANGGRLSERLDLRVDRLTGAMTHEVYAGTLGGLADVDLGNLPAAAAQVYRFTVTLPEGGPVADDPYNGSAVEIGWRWTATSDEDPGAKDKDKQPETPAPESPATAREPQAEPRPAPVLPDVAPRGTAADPADAEGPAAPAGRPVRMWIGGSRVQRLGRGGTLRLLARCRPACSIEATPRLRAGRRWVRLPARRVGAARAAGAAATLTVRLTRPELKRLRKALKKPSVDVRLTLRATAPGHAAGQVTRTLRVRR